MMKEKRQERYHGYILTIVKVGEVNTSKEIRERLFDFNPNEKKELSRVFHHKDMPSAVGVATILRLSPHFEKEEQPRGRNQWRRVS